MPDQGLTMRKIREVLRPKFDYRLTNCKIARSIVGEYPRQFSDAGLTWPIDENLGDGTLGQLLFPPTALPSQT